MTKKNAAIILILIFTAIFQISFAPHFTIFAAGWFEWINFITLVVAIIALFEKRRRGFAWKAAFFGGLFLDIYSRRFFGFWIIIFIAAVAVIKFVIKKYVRIPSYW